MSSLNLSFGKSVERSPLILSMRFEEATDAFVMDLALSISLILTWTVEEAALIFPMGSRAGTVAREWAVILRLCYDYWRERELSLLLPTDL